MLPNHNRVARFGFEPLPQTSSQVSVMVIIKNKLEWFETKVKSAAASLYSGKLCHCMRMNPQHDFAHDA